MEKSVSLAELSYRRRAVMSLDQTGEDGADDIPNRFKPTEKTW